jgi:anti-anti-sigma regulatory factor
MRVNGCIHSGSDLGADGHACWVFDQDQEFVDASLEYLTDGLRSGQRLAYVGSEPVAEQRERLEPLGDTAALIDSGTLQLFALDDLYHVGEPVDADAQLATYSAATDGALADGYTGLRVEAHVRWESIADRFMSVRPLSALCGYRREALPDTLLHDLAAVHPATNVERELVPFHFFAESGDLVLSGEVDLFSAEDLDRVLTLACSAEETLALDLGSLGFIDHHGLEILISHTRRLATESGCAVRNTPPVVDRLCQLLEVKL